MKKDKELLKDIYLDLPPTKGKKTKRPRKPWLATKLRSEQLSLPEVSQLVSNYGRISDNCHQCFVIDPFAGTHIVGVAAYSHGCTYIGFDNDIASKFVAAHWIPKTIAARKLVAGSGFPDLEPGSSDDEDEGDSEDEGEGDASESEGVEEAPKPKPAKKKRKERKKIVGSKEEDEEEEEEEEEEQE